MLPVVAVHDVVSVLPNIASKNGPKNKKMLREREIEREREGERERERCTCCRP